MFQQQVQKKLYAANQYQKRKQETIKSYIAIKDILTGAEDQKYAQEAEQIQIRMVEQQNLSLKNRHHCSAVTAI